MKVKWDYCYMEKYEMFQTTNQIYIHANKHNSDMLGQQLDIGKKKLGIVDVLRPATSIWRRNRSTKQRLPPAMAALVVYNLGPLGNIRSIQLGYNFNPHVCWDMGLL